MPTVLLSFSLCTGSCTVDFGKWLYSRLLIKADLRISIEDDHRKKNLKILVFRPPFPGCQFPVRMSGAPSPADGGPVSLTRLVTALRESLVKAGRNGDC